MNRKTACKIAENYLGCELGATVDNVAVKSYDSNNGIIVVRARDTEKKKKIDLDRIYEVTIDTNANTISAHQVLREGTLNHYEKDKTTVSQLAIGQYFRIPGDCVIYKYCGIVNEFGANHHVACRKGRTSCFNINDMEVYPMNR